MTKIIVLGASDKNKGYSYKALKLLKAKNFDVAGLHPKLKEIEGIPVFASLKEIQESIDTITLYISSEISSALEKDILDAKPKRVIFNPGAENPELMDKLDKANINTIEACTLVMLQTGQF